jgi:preprotein translocase subunit Sss1
MIARCLLKNEQKLRKFIKEMERVLHNAIEPDEIKELRRI